MNQFKILSTHVPAVNFHVWEPCNMNCKFCFATFQDVKKELLPKGHLPKEQAIKVVELLCKSGIQKLNFAGGEPTLCPWLYEMLACAKKHGLTTSIVTNGSRLNHAWLERYADVLDWIGLSIDSFSEVVNIQSGRALGRKRPKAISKDDYIALCESIRRFGYKLKLNTVVHCKNWQEDMASYIKECKPQRWKIFQVLPVDGQNDGDIEDYLITERQYEQFVGNHQQNLAGTGMHIVPENNSKMRGSYLMVDPAGRFFDNVQGQHTYSNSIIEVGVAQAAKQVHCDIEAFVARGGQYDW